MAQTAVEWLEEQLNKWSDGRFYLPPHLFEKAKEIEKQQIIISTPQAENPSAKGNEQ